MWQQEKKDNTILSLGLLLALATTSVTASFFVSSPLMAQSAVETPSFPLPETVENGTTVRIDGSSSLAVINQSLKQSFEKQFSGTKVEAATNGTESALKALLDGKIDVAAIGRGLTPEEKAQGLEQVRLHREKIAIVVSADNAFKGSLTDRQFARIFRGRITDWSEVGGTPGKIRVIDRPITSEIRAALNNYPVFQAAKFATGSTATQASEDNTVEIVKQLGKDGISYATANQVSKITGVRVLQLHQTSPDDPKYPFSQPLVYVYKKNPSPAIAGFLGFALASPGQKAIEEGRTAEAEAIAKGESQAFFTATSPTGTPEATTSPGALATPEATTPSTALATPEATTSPTGETLTPVAPIAVDGSSTIRQISPWWLLLPVAILGGLLLWFVRRSPTARAVDNLPELNPDEPLDQTPSNLALGETHAIANLPEGTTPNINGALATAAAVTILSANSHKKPQDTEETSNLATPPVAIPPELEESPWDIEAPAAVVNTAYPHIQDVSKVTSNADNSDIVPDLPIVPAVTNDGENENIAVSGDLPAKTPQPEPNLPDANSTTQAQPDIWSIIQGLANNSSKVNPADSSESVELPAPEVTTSLPELSNGGDNFTAELPPTASQLLGENLEIGLESDIWSSTEEFNNTTEFSVITDSTPLPSIEETSNNLELPTPEVVPPLPDLPDIPEDALNLVADAAEPIEQEIVAETENITQPNLGDLAGEAALLGAGLGAWAGIYGIDNAPEPEVEQPAHKSEENLPTVDATSLNLSDTEEKSSIVVRPRSPEWAYISWYVSHADQQKLRNADISELALQLYDVTEIDLSYQSPRFLQQYECEKLTHDRYVAIPVSDRDYIVEIGYVTPSNDWVTIARSATVHIFSHPYIDPTTEDLPMVDDESSVIFTPRTAKWAYVSWYISDTFKQALRDNNISQLALRLYDVTNIDLSYQIPQLIQQYECQEITQDLYVAIPVSERDYVTELGYLNKSDRWVTIARSATVRIFSRPPGDFWFVADAELIIHGATAPGATVSIAGNQVKVKSDGTFHLRVPFSDDLIEYLITAAANEGQSKSIYKKFFQETSEG